MRIFLLPALLLAGLTGFGQAAKKKVPAASANSPSGLTAVMPTATTANALSADTTYLSLSDFSGTGTVADPIRIKTAALQTWMQSLPGYSAGGNKYLASDFTWKTVTSGNGGGNGPTQLNGPSLTATVLSSSSIALNWTNVDNENGYTLERSTDGANWITIAQPNPNNTQFTNTGLSASTLYYFRVKATSNSAAYTDSPYGSASATTSPAGGPTASPDAVLFDVATAFSVQQHPDGPGTYYSAGGSGIAQAVKKIAAGTDGLAYFQYHAGTGEYLSLGYTTDNGVQGYEHWTGGLYLNYVNLKAYGYNGSTTDLGVTAVDNYYYGFRRNGGLIEVVSSPDANSWTVLGYANYSADDLYIQAYFQTPTSKIKVLGQNLVSY